IMKELKIPVNNILAIPEITETDVFNAKLNALRKHIQKITKSEHFKVPASANPPPRHVNGYFKFENRMQILNEHSSTNNLVVNTLNEDVKKFLSELNKLLQNESDEKTSDSTPNLHQKIFRSLSTRAKADKLAEEGRNLPMSMEYNKRMQIIIENQRQLDELKKEYASIQHHPLVTLYNKIIQEKDNLKRVLFENAIILWQKPLIEPILKERSYLKSKRQQTENQLKNHEEEIFGSYGDKIAELGQILDVMRINREHFWRELIHVYENLDKFENKDSFDVDKFFDGYLEYVKQGGEFELIDGNNSQINYNALNRLFGSIHGEHDKKELFVISIIGPQSTGKSTLLNFLFNTSFQMSAGRCTQGLYASYFKTNYEKAQECLILDSEGLLSIERKDDKFDKQMTILAMALSQVMIVNVNEEMNKSMKRIISMSLFAAKELKMCMNKKPIIVFVLRNMIHDDK
ncbi:von Willebrand factor type A domain containing protein, partial [Reticulomyxa filosa]